MQTPTTLKRPGSFAFSWMTLLLITCFPARPDTLVLTGGETLVGRVLEEQTRRIIFQSQNLGKIKIPRDRVQQIIREPVPVAGGPSVGSGTNVTASSLLTNRIAAPPASPPFYPWTSLAPSLDTLDWIELKSGEWLRGRMLSLQNDKLEFDSEEMDLREFDWEDIRTLRSPRLTSVWLGQDQILIGSVLITTNQVMVLGEQTNRFSRADLVAVTPTGKSERNKWSGKASIGLTLRSGNTKQIDYTARLDIDRRTPLTHLSLDYLGNYGKVEEVETVNNQRVTLEFDYFLSRRLFLLVPYAEYYKDPLQNLKHRVTVGGGVGYDLIKNRRVEWNLTAGPAYQRNWYESVEAGSDEDPGAMALVLGTRLDVELTKRLDFIAELRSQITSREVGESTHHGVATLEFEIHKRLDLDVSLVWDRVSNPKPDADGVTPVKDDFRLTVGLGLDF